MFRRFPWLLGSVVFGSLLLALTVSFYPLFISATETSLVKDAVTNPLVTPFGAGIEYRIDNLPLSSAKFPIDVIGKRFRTSMAKQPLLGRTVESVLGPAVSVSFHGETSAVGGRLFAGTGASQHVSVVQTNGGQGVWIAQLTAQPLGIKPGDVISLSYEGQRPVEVPVSTVYRSLYELPRTPYWYRWQFEIFCLKPLDCRPPPPFIIVPQSQLMGLMTGLGSRNGTFSWEAPVRDAGSFTLDANGPGRRGPSSTRIRPPGRTRVTGLPPAAPPGTS